MKGNSETWEFLRTNDKLSPFTFFKSLIYYILSIGLLLLPLQSSLIKKIKLMLILTRALIGRLPPSFAGKHPRSLLLMSSKTLLNSPFETNRRSFSFCTSENSLRHSQQTFKLLVSYLQRKVNYVKQLEQTLIQQSSVINSTMNKEQARIQISQMTPLVTLYEKMQATIQNVKDLKEMIKETKDKQEKDILNEELENSENELSEMRDECWGLLVPPAPYDKADDIIMEFRPGAGGQESSIFVEDISTMYSSFASSQGWRCNITNAVKQTGTSRGYKVLDMRVQGPDCHKMMRCESGVHKVIRIPETESKGRLHSSTIAMVVMPVVPFSFEVDPKDIKYQFTKSSGPGGQAVNKIESACRAIHVPTGLAVFIQEQRSQDANKRRATDLLKQKLFEIEYKKSVEQQQSKRKSQVTTLDRSEKIRTYNYPQDRITDHRTGLTKFGISEMMNGEYLEEFIDTYTESVEKEKIDALILELYQEAGITPPKIHHK